MSDFWGDCIERSVGRKTPLWSALPAQHPLCDTLCPFHRILGKAVLQGYCQGNGKTCLLLQSALGFFMGLEPAYQIQLVNRLMSL